MKCSYCEQAALFLCECTQPYMCPIHLGIHLASKPGHQFEELKLKLSKSKSIILERLQKVNEIKAQILKVSQTLIKDIKRLSYEADKKLSQISKSYLKMLQSDELCLSKIQEIEKIASNDIIIRPIDFENIRFQLVKQYSTKFSSCFDISEMRKNEFWKYHGLEIVCGAVSEDGNILVTGGNDSFVRVWDLEEKRPLFVLLGHKDNVTCVTLAKDSQFIISGSNDTSIIIWSINKRSIVATLREHEDCLFKLAYNESRSLIFSLDCSDHVYIWDFVKHSIIKKIENIGDIYEIIPIASKNFLIICLYDKIIFYDTENNLAIKELTGNENFVITKKEDKIASLSEDNMKIIIYDTNTFIHLLTINAFKSVESMATTPDSQFIISEHNCSLIIWSILTGAKVNEFSFNYLCIYIPFKDSILAIGLNEELNISEIDFNKKKADEIFLLREFNPNNKSLFIQSNLFGYVNRKKAYVWDSNDKIEKLCIKPKTKDNFAKLIKISNNGKLVIIVKSNSKIIECWSLETNEKIGEFEGHKDEINCAEIFGDSLTLASGSDDEVVRVWNLKTFKLISKFNGHSNGVKSINFIEEKNLLISLSTCELIIWDLSNQRKYGEYRSSSYLIVVNYLGFVFQMIVSA